MDRPIIEELDPEEQGGEFDAQLEQILKAKRNDAYQTLSATFEFLKRKTAFFERADASKQLARLLKEVKTPAQKPAAPKPAPAPSKAPTGPSTPQAVPNGSSTHPAPASASAPSAAPSAPAEAGPSGTQVNGSADPPKPAPGSDEEEDGPGTGKGRKPTLGNGAEYEKYSFVQTLKDATVSIPMPKGTRGRDCDVELKANHLRVGLKGQEPILDGDLHETIKVVDSGWSLADGTIDVLLMKENKQNWWKTIMKGDPEINTQKVMPENSKLSDLDPETAAWVEKVQYDNHRKQLGLPTSEEQQKQDKLKDFMKAHPEMDFSKVKFS